MALQNQIGQLQQQLAELTQRELRELGGQVEELHGTWRRVRQMVILCEHKLICLEFTDGSILGLLLFVVLIWDQIGELSGGTLWRDIATILGSILLVTFPIPA